MSYEQKHNEANGEDNRDGTRRQLEPQLGRRGRDRRVATCSRLRDRDRAQPPRHPRLLAGRADAERTATRSAARSAATTTPTARTTSISWVRLDARRARRASCSPSRARCSRSAASIRCSRRRSFFRGAPVSGDGVKDVTWLRPDGVEMTAEDWSRPDGARARHADPRRGERRDRRPGPPGGGRDPAARAEREPTRPAPSRCRKLGAWQEVVRHRAAGRAASRGLGVRAAALVLALLRLSLLRLVSATEPRASATTATSSPSCGRLLEPRGAARAMENRDGRHARRPRRGGHRRRPRHRPRRRARARGGRRQGGGERLRRLGRRQRAVDGAGVRRRAGDRDARAARPSPAPSRSPTGRAPAASSARRSSASAASTSWSPAPASCATA